MQAGQVPVVAGFQGIGPDNRVTTLGRGGSDLSAVARMVEEYHADTGAQNVAATSPA
jgi:aspartate kinase